MNFEDFKEFSMVIIGFLVIFVFFSFNFWEAFRIWYAFLIVMFIPGLFIARWLIPDWDGWEQALFGAFIGFGGGSFVIYYLSIIGFNSVQVSMISGLSVLSVVLMFTIEKFFKKKMS